MQSCQSWSLHYVHICMSSLRRTSLVGMYPKRASFSNYKLKTILSGASCINYKNPSVQPSNLNTTHHVSSTIYIPWLKQVIIIWFRVHHRALALDVFNKWHVAFHGTRIDSVKAILECDDLLISGMWRYYRGKGLHDGGTTFRFP